MKSYVTNTRVAFSEVFARSSYMMIASVFAILAFALAVWLPNLRLITSIFSSSNAPLAAKLKIAVSLLGGIGTNFSVFSASYTIAIAILFGMNIAMIVYFFKKRREQVKGEGLIVGLGGVASGALGVGCAACGSFLLSTILASFGAAGALAILPLKGGEFGLLSVILLAVSIVLISKQITKPQTCTT